MYKVFINEKVICFTNNVENYQLFSNGFVLNFYSSIDTPFIVNLLLSKKDKMNVIIVVDDYENAFKTFKTYFKIIKAAGGIVNNKKNEKLFIYRLDKWDLPKGKIEKGEGIEEAAIREVEEECGINGLSIEKKLNDTFHIYQLKDQLILKQTYWFKMSSAYEGELVPQLEENITKAKWLTDAQISDKVIEKTYASIKELLTT